MAKTPSWPYGKVIRVLESFGYAVVRQKGSHIRLKHERRRPLTIPAHNPIARGTLRKIIRDSQISLEELLDNS